MHESEKRIEYEEGLKEYVRKEFAKDSIDGPFKQIGCEPETFYNTDMANLCATEGWYFVGFVLQSPRLVIALFHSPEKMEELERTRRGRILTPR